MEFDFTVQPATAREPFERRRYRLGLSRVLSNKLKRGDPLTLILDDPSLVIEVSAACGRPNEVSAACGRANKKTYDVNSIELDRWIKKHGFHDYVPGKPTRLIFDELELNRKFRYLREKK